MASPRHLRKAPINEALVDLRVDRRLDVAADTFADLRQILQESYPQVDDQRGVSAKVEFRDGKLFTETDDLGFQGLHFTSTDGLTIAQFRPDGFTVNRLRPYEDWQHLFAEASRLWPLFVERAAPLHVTRAALRYINQLALPLDEGEDFDLSLTAAPPIPSEL